MALTVFMGVAGFGHGAVLSVRLLCCLPWALCVQRGWPFMLAALRGPAVFMAWCSAAHPALTLHETTRCSGGRYSVSFFLELFLSGDRHCLFWALSRLCSMFRPRLPRPSLLLSVSCVVFTIS